SEFPSYERKGAAACLGELREVDFDVTHTFGLNLDIYRFRKGHSFFGRDHLDWIALGKNPIGPSSDFVVRFRLRKLPQVAEHRIIHEVHVPNLAANSNLACGESIRHVEQARENLEDAPTTAGRGRDRLLEVRP